MKESIFLTNLQQRQACSCLRQFVVPEQKLCKQKIWAISKQKRDKNASMIIHELNFSSSGKKSRHSSTNEDRSESSSKKKVPVDKSGQDTKKALANNDKDEGESTQEKTATICEGDGGKDKSEESQRLKVAKEWAEGLRGSGTAQDPKTPVPPLSSELPLTPASPTGEFKSANHD